MPSVPPSCPPPGSGHSKQPSGKYRGGGGWASTTPRGPLAGLPKRPKPDALRNLTPKQIQELLNVEAFAEDQGVAFAVHVTVHWQCDPDFAVSDWPKRLNRPGGFLDKLRRWLKRRGVPFALAWLNEMGLEYGPHTHIVLHLPHPKGDKGRQGFETIVADLAAWIVRAEGLHTGMLDRFRKPWKPVQITGGKIGMRTRSGRAGLCRYWLKTIDPKDVTYTGAGAEPRADVLGIKPARAGRLPPGVQRFGASRNLSVQARRAAGWRELTTVEELRARLNP